MRKSFPVSKGLRSPSFASRYAKLRKFRKLAGREEGRRKDSKLLLSEVPLKLRSAKHHVGTPFGLALLIGFGIFGTILAWLHLLN